MCHVCQNWNHRSRSRESENFSKSRQSNYQNIPCDLTKKMNTHTLCFCPLIRKLQAFEILKWAKESQWTKQRTSNFTREIQLIFSLQWKYNFLYFHGCEIQLLLKYALYLINIFPYLITLYTIKCSVRYNKINITFPARVKVENIIPRNVIISLGCASVDNHIPLDDIFDYHPRRECNIYIISPVATATANTATCLP